jgi:hypothetical protein
MKRSGIPQSGKAEGRSFLVNGYLVNSLGLKLTAIFNQ